MYHCEKHGNITVSSVNVNKYTGKVEGCAWCGGMVSEGHKPTVYHKPTPVRVKSTKRHAVTR